MSAFPTQPAHGLPVALPLPLPLPDGAPWRVEQYWFGGFPVQVPPVFAPPEFMSAVDIGWTFPLVPAVPLVWDVAVVEAASAAVLAASPASGRLTDVIAANSTRRRRVRLRR